MMKAGLCRKLALGNIRKNYRFFVPRILSEIGLLACFYIIFTLSCDDRLASVKGGDYLPTFMWMGAVIIGLLSSILMLYTNSFLMKQRKREFGLYSVLGMEKKHICRVLFHESAICSILSIVTGLLFGMLFYKIASLAICRILHAEIVAGFYYVSLQTIIPAGLIFLLIDFIAYIVNCIVIGRMKPVDMLSSVSTGEKEPKTKWILLVLGLIALGAGYYISLTTVSPLQAILLFFAAVLLVIVGTYFLYVAGSVFVLKALRKREDYYYKPGHFTAISGLLYRMKQNAVGLASVAILSTGVLVMISSTFCLYTRTGEALSSRYPQDYYLSTIYFDDEDHSFEIPEDIIDKNVRTCAEKYDLVIKDAFSNKYFDVAFSHKPGELITDRESIADEIDLSDLCMITFMTEEVYQKQGGECLGLHDNEVAVYSFTNGDSFGDTTFTLCGETYTVTIVLSSFLGNTHMFTVNSYGMVVTDEAFDAIFNAQKDAYGANASKLQSNYCVSFENREKIFEAGSGFAEDVSNANWAYIESEGYHFYRSEGYDAVWDARKSLYGMYGTLLFLGILLGIVCLFATVLIIYYKQISEGYEDRNRYQIMRKIGMTDIEVKQTIHSQIMLVFFLPLLTAGIHVAFGYPILTKLMSVLLLDNPWLFAKWCLIVYAAFALVYTFIYTLTAKTYYKIVY